ncbi:hypothetical protein [Methylomonas fluvii]|nr:hypothetical protein [Methylomonas fluvii]
MNSLGIFDIHLFKPLSVCETKGGGSSHAFWQILGARE